MEQDSQDVNEVEQEPEQEAEESPEQELLPKLGELAENLAGDDENNEIAPSNDGINIIASDMKQEDAEEDDPEPTFATTTEDLDVHIGLLNPMIPKHETIEESNRKEFMHIINDSEGNSQRQKTKITRHSTISRNSEPPLTESQIQEYADNVMKGKPLKIDDPNAISQIINELDRRRLEALSNSEYLKSKKIGDMIDQVKTELYKKDREYLYQENVAQLKKRYQDSVDALESAKEMWKKKMQEFKEQCKTEVLDLQDKQKNELLDFEAKWTDPATQRKYNKRSPYLLQQKKIEQYMVLSGNLEAAETVKKINQVNEKHEVAQQYQTMVEDFENAQNQFIFNQQEEMDKLKAEQEFRYKSLLLEEDKCFEVHNKRIAATLTKLEDEKNMDNFIAKKFKKPSNQVLPVTVISGADELPPLTRGKTVRSTQDKSKPQPLQLPPLKTRRVNQQKITVSFK